jgi:metallophosphoesterase (TIGR00282 family)
MQPIECPFRTVRDILGKLKKETNIILVDMHAEATSEKIALSYFLDGQVSAVVGTHTHVQTADEKILPAGTAYITDLGMTGPHDSVIGRKKEKVIERFVSGLPTRFELADQDLRLEGAVIAIDPNTAKAVSIKRIQKKLEGG